MDNRDRIFKPRRDFMQLLATGLAALSVRAVLGARRLFGAQDAHSNLLASIRIDDHPELQTVGGFVLLKRTADGDILITRSSDAEYSAMSVVCPHMQCSVKVKSASLIQCPCHQSAYRIDGTYISGPAKTGLKRYPVVVQDGVISIARPPVGIGERGPQQ